MIPFDFITEWRDHAPWEQDLQVEQDLVLSRAVVEIFTQPRVASTLAFRGGTALYKLYLTPPARYSEDIDMVQIAPGPIGETLDAIRAMLDPWLGSPKRTIKEKGATLRYRMQSEGQRLPMRLKIEINMNEHFTSLGINERPMDVRSRWYSGAAQIMTFQLDEFLGSKLRALYQRKKGRDLFDLWTAAGRTAVNPDRLVECFLRFLEHDGLRVSRAEFESNLIEKLTDTEFTGDVAQRVLRETDPEGPT